MDGLRFDQLLRRVNFKPSVARGLRRPRFGSVLPIEVLPPGFRSARLLIPTVLLLFGGCNAFTDPATRLAYAIAAGADQLGSAEGASYSIRHTPAHAKECSGPYSVQLDKVGALILWCKSDSGDTLASGSTSYHSRFVDTPRTYVVEKPAGSTLTIEITRRNGRAVVSAVR